jgi:hypothetical protein
MTTAGCFGLNSFRRPEMLRVPIFVGAAVVSTTSALVAQSSIDKWSAVVVMSSVIIGAAASVIRATWTLARKVEANTATTKAHNELLVKLLGWVPCWPKWKGRPMTPEELDQFGPNAHFGACEIFTPEGDSKP